MAQNSKWFENDIELPLNPSQKKIVEEWLPKFIEARRNHFGNPLQSGDQLLIGAPDLLDFLSFIDFSKSSEFDLVGLRREFQTVLEELLNADLIEIKREHYQQIFSFVREFNFETKKTTFESDRFHESIKQLS